jgi:CBS domain-containing protein
MLPLSQLQAVPPEMPAVKAVELMTRENLDQLSVVSDGKLQGIFSRGQLLRFVQVYSGSKSDRHGRAA